MAFKSFEEIEVWQEARALSKMVHVFTRRAIEKKDWTWASQTDGAALSVMANIAEGNDAQTDPEFINFLGYAKRSAAEVRSHLYAGLDRSYLSKEEFIDAKKQSEKVAKMTASLIRYLRQNQRSSPRQFSSSKNL